MREIFDYINTNSFLTTIIGVIVGGFISSATSIYLSSKDLKERRKDEARRENERKYENKAEFKLEKVVEMGTEKPTLEAFLVPYRYEYTNDFKKCKIIYPEDIKEKTKYKYIDYYLKNIGNSDVNELALCAIFKEHNMLLEYNGLDFAIEKGIVNSSIYDEMKVQKDETIMIRVYYLEEHKVQHLYTCTMTIAYKDAFNNLYEQPFWYEKEKLSPPTVINEIEYKRLVTPLYSQMHS